jgi:DNA-binding PadR family transcriptional regulator
MTTDEQIKAWILNKMRSHRFIGGRHTDVKNIRKGAPPKYYDIIDKQLEELRKSGMVVFYMKVGAKHVSLNQYMLREINEFIRKNYTEIIFE